VRARRYEPGSGWLGEENVQEVSSAGTRPPEVAVDSNGYVIAVWVLSRGAGNEIWASRYTPGVGWGIAERISLNSAGSAQDPHIAMTPDGEAVAVWAQSNDSQHNTWASRFTPQAEWSSPELIETDDTASTWNPRVAVDPSGNATAVWSRIDATGQGIRANRFTPEMGWGAAQILETGRAGPAVTPQVGMDSDGNAIVVWHQTDLLFRSDVWSKRFTPGAGWSGGMRVETQDSVATNPQIAVAPGGDAIAVWEQMGAMYKDAWANRFTPESGWGPPSLLEISNAGDVRLPQVASDAAGNAIAVWMQHDGSEEDVWANRYTLGAGWTGAVLLEQADGVRALNPRVAVGLKGSAVVVWRQLLSMPTSLWANRFE